VINAAGLGPWDSLERPWKNVMHDWAITSRLNALLLLSTKKAVILQGMTGADFAFQAQHTCFSKVSKIQVFL